MISFSKIYKFAEVFQDLSYLENMFWDNSPPTQKQTPISNRNTPKLRAGFDPPTGYSRITRTVGQNLQQISYNILRQNINQPFGTQIPFEYNGIKYIALIEEHSPSNSIPRPHPGVSLLVENKPTPTTNTPAKIVQDINLPKENTNNFSKRTLQKVRELDPRLQPIVLELIRKGWESGLRPEIVEGRRSQERQNELYEQGRSKPGQVVTWTRNSKHTQGLAVDIAQLDENGKITYNATPGFWEQMGSIGKSLGLTWGGDWKKTPDKPHFQLNS